MPTTKASHTPTPLYIEEDMNSAIRVARDLPNGETEIIADFFKNDDRTDAKKNAEHYMTAVNAYAQHVAALQAAMRVLRLEDGFSASDSDEYVNAKEHWDCGVRFAAYKAARAALSGEPAQRDVNAELVEAIDCLLRAFAEVPSDDVIAKARSKARTARYNATGEL